MQKTYLMLESAAHSVFSQDRWNVQGFMPIASNPRFFRNEGSVTKSESVQVTQLRIWNSLIYLTMEQESSDATDHKFPKLDYTFNILGTLTGGNQILTSPKSVTKLFNGILPTRHRFSKKEGYEGGKEEALDMLFSFMQKGLFDKLGKRSYTTAREFLEHAIAVYNRRYFDFDHITKVEGLETYSIGNLLVYVYFEVNGTKLVANIVYMGDIKLSIEVDVTKVPRVHTHTVEATLAEYLAYELRPSQLLSGRGNNEASMTTSGTEDEASDKLKVSTLRLEQAASENSGLQVCEAWRLHVGDMLHLSSNEGEHSLRIKKISLDAGSLQVELEGEDLIIFHNHIQNVAISRRPDSAVKAERTLTPIEGVDHVLCRPQDLQDGDIVVRDLDGKEKIARVKAVHTEGENFVVVFYEGPSETLPWTTNTEVLILKLRTKAQNSLGEKDSKIQVLNNLVYDPDSEANSCEIGDWNSSMGKWICCALNKTYFVGTLVSVIEDDPELPDEVEIRVQEGPAIGVSYCRAMKDTIVSCSTIKGQIEAIREKVRLERADRGAISIQD